MSTATSFSFGDFVQIAHDCTHSQAGQRGYVANEPRRDGSIEVYVDSYQGSIPTLKPLACHKVPINLLNLIRKSDDSVLVRVCDYASGEFPRLGVVSSDPVTRASGGSDESPYDKLPRPPAQDLPGPHSGDCRFNNQRTETIYCQIYAGKFVLEVSHTFINLTSNYQINARLAAKGTPNYCFIVSVESDEDHPKAENGLLKVGMLLFYTDPNNIGMAGASFQWLEEFYLTDDQQHHLAWRVLHLYLRVFGNDNVGLRSMTTQFLKVVDVCRGNGWWKEMLDASILWSDYVQHTRQPDECQVQYFGKICEALQMNNRFREAAELYGQLARDYGCKLADKRQLVEAYMNQGGSYKRCANFDDAEVALLNGFRALFTSFNLNNAFTLSPAVNITFYGLLARHISECYQFRLDNPDNSEAALANETLVLLLSMSQLAGCSIPASDRVPADKIVKSQFNAKGAARKALAAAFKTETVDEFYQVLRSWKQAGASVEVTATNKFKQGRDYTTARGIKHGSRDEIRADVRTDSCLPKRKCYYPNCPEGYMAVEKLSQCSKCKIAQYCSRDCQAAHWKEHKPLCTAARQG